MVFFLFIKLPSSNKKYLCFIENKNILSSAQKTIALEAEAIQSLGGQLNQHFADAVSAIKESKGRLIISGIGKSANIAQKLVATFNSTGTPAIFMHAADAIHGDLGMMQAHDVALLISKSGESEEVKVLIPLIKNFGNKIVSLCGNENSYLAKHSDYFINCTVSEEACPNNLAPTSSTTAQLVMGDAMAVALLELKGFGPEDFARFHPGGALGKQLYLLVDDLYANHDKPSVDATASINEVILEITSKRLGATAVLESGKLVGMITDGDIRRMIEKNQNFAELSAKNIMNQSPKSIQKGSKAVEGLRQMRANNISQLIVLEDNSYAGMFHIHDLIREGIV
jgi:arabinose-5-phosphate isomerase